MIPSDAELRLACQLRQWARLANQWADTIESRGRASAPPPEILTPGEHGSAASIPSPAMIPPSPGTFSEDHWAEFLEAIFPDERQEDD